MAYSNKERTEIINEICNRISKGMALRNILKEKSMPDSTTFYIWLEDDEKKSKQYARACEDRSDGIFDEILTIADDQEGDTYKNEDGIEFTNHNVIQRSKLRVDTRKWMLSKLNPKKYSDKIQIDTTEFKEQPLFNV